MKRTIIIAGSIALAYIMLTSRYASYGSGAGAVHEDTAAVSFADKEQDSLYIMKEYDKRIAVFERGRSEPVYVSGVLVRDLPKADRELLSDGIRADSKKELDRLIEDYCS